MAKRLTALILTRNEAVNLPDCLASVRWADEVMVVDSGSTDGTRDIARDAGARVLEHPYANYGAQNNWAIPQATHEWLLIVDADERVTPALREEIQGLLAGTPDADMYWVGRDNWFFGRRIRHSGWANDRVLRLFRRDEGRYEEWEIHPNIIPKGRVSQLRGRLEHHTYRSFAHYMDKFASYSARSALDLRRGGRRASVIALAVRPAWRFFRMYVLQGGFLDGRAGFTLCCLAAAQVFVRYTGLWVHELDDGAVTGDTVAPP